MTHNIPPQEVRVEDGRTRMLGWPDIGWLVFRYGYKRFAGHETGYVLETNVLDLEDFTILPSRRGLGYGSQLIKELGERAKAHNMQYARMQIINPIIVAVIDTLHARGSILDVAYVEAPVGGQPLKPTVEILTSGERLSSTMAVAAIEASQNEFETNPEEVGGIHQPGVECVVRLRSF